MEDNKETKEMNENKEKIKSILKICMLCFGVIIFCLVIAIISYNIFSKKFKSENKVIETASNKIIEEGIKEIPEITVDLKDYETEARELERIKQEEEERIKQEELKKQEEQKKQQQQKFTAESMVGYNYYIKVNYTANTVTIYEKDSYGNFTVPIKAMVCSTGASTPRSGVYRTPQKARWGTLIGPSYGQYCTRITGQILFHSVPYLNRNDNTSLEYWEYDRLGETRSLGCIRLTTIDAKWIFDNCPLGTQVEFYSSYDPGPLGKPTAPKISNSGENLRGWDPTDPDPNNPWKYQNTTPTPIPTVEPTVTPTPTATPTAVPTVKPTATPTAVPTVKPTATPTAVPTVKPTATPTAVPTTKPTAAPTAVPTAKSSVSTKNNIVDNDLGTLDLNNNGANINSTIDIMSYIFKLYTF